jgi:VanZ family protein
MKKRIILVLVWTAILLGLLLAPGDGGIIPRWCSFRGFDKVIHCILYGITAMVSVYGTAFLPKFRERLIFGLIFGLALGFSTEFGQSMIPGRDMSYKDLLANVLGTISGLVLYVLLYRKAVVRERFKL